MEIIDDLTYTTNHCDDDTLQFLLKSLHLIHPVNPTSVYRNPIQTNLCERLYTLLKRQRHEVRHSKCLKHLFYSTPKILSRHCLRNLPTEQLPFSKSQQYHEQFQETRKSQKNDSQTSQRHSSLTDDLPLLPHKNHKEDSLLWRHQSKISGGTNLRVLLTETKITPPPHLNPNVIYKYEISCNPALTALPLMLDKPTDFFTSVTDSWWPDRPYYHQVSSGPPLQDHQTQWHTMRWTNITIPTQNKGTRHYSGEQYSRGRYIGKPGWGGRYREESQDYIVMLIS